jgi:predicted outer membrane protein
MRIPGTLVMSLLVAVSGCSDDDSSEFTPTSSTPASDGQLLQVLVTANQSEVDAGNIALVRATDASVKQFAQQMVTEHSAALQQLLTLAGSSSFAVASSGSNQTFVSESTRTTTLLLSAPTGNSFDLTYMCSQVRSHSGLIQTIDQSGPAQNAQLAAAAQMARSMAIAHLGLAQQIISTLGGNPSAGSGNTNSGAITSNTTSACAANGGTTFGAGTSGSTNSGTTGNTNAGNTGSSGGNTGSTNGGSSSNTGSTGGNTGSTGGNTGSSGGTTGSSAGTSGSNTGSTGGSTGYGGTTGP